ncbi:MAG: hypothetical protein L0Y58_06815 [Verrucomicrobia subdivision 3 bacterium]|nr:hypothetical protein [Limisphaerales bacterium]
MCQCFLSDARFYRLLFRIDQSIAEEEQQAGCLCGGVLHSARYPRKPRGFRLALDESYDYRLSFCCARDGCRRRRTPPSVRFLGRKVYLSVIVVLSTALQHGLTEKRRQGLIEMLDIAPQTMVRWRRFWHELFPQSRCWQAERGRFMPPVEIAKLPGELLGRFIGETLSDRLSQLLVLICPVTTSSSGFLRAEIDPQKMRS